MITLMLIRRLLLPAGAVIAIAGFVYPVVSAQAPTPPIQPTYTADQAQRGETVVSEHCLDCHGELLQGTEGPALKGESFMKWLTGRDIGAAFIKIRDTMPVDLEDSVSETDKLDALAYLLQVNGVPEGDTELPADLDALAKMRVQPQSPRR